MKKILFALLLCITANTGLFAIEGNYLTIGTSIQNSSFDAKDAYNKKQDLSDTFSTLKLGVGFYIDNRMRTEIAYQYRTNFEDSQNMSLRDYAGAARFGEYEFTTRTHDLSVNIYYDLFQEATFRPYVGIGIGLSYLNVKTSPIGAMENYKETGLYFSPSLYVGVVIHASEKSFVDVGFVYNRIFINKGIYDPIDTFGAQLSFRFNI